MGLKNWKEFAQKKLKQENFRRLALALGICGILLIYLSSLFEPGKRKSEQPVPQKAETGTSEKELEEALKRVVCAITGEESPTVMVTFESSGRSVYAADETKSIQREAGGDKGEAGREESQKTHIVLKDTDGAQHALTVTEIQPKVKGVVVVSRRAGDPVIREKLTEAVRTALDISSAKVCVTDSG